MRIKLIFIGKTKEAYIREGISSYISKIKPYHPIEIIHIKESKTSRPPAEARNIKLDTQKVLDTVGPSDILALLDPDGKPMKSTQFAAWIKSQAETGAKNLVFGLGGPFGLDKSALDRANLKLSLSRMTLTHEMSRLVLLEQIFRASRINAGHPYHY